MSIISLGLAENYAMLGNRYIGLYTAGDVKGFMGSNFLSYPPDPNQAPPLDSNGIELNSGSIPNAPIVNGAAAKQAIADVNTAITQYLLRTVVYNGPAVGDLNTIITGPGLYNITGNLITNVDVTLNRPATDIYVFNVTGSIDIQNNITLAGGLLPQNVIFIAGVYSKIYNPHISLTVSGIYISTGDYSIILDGELTGRLICTSTINGSSNNENSTITAPQFA